MQSAASPSLFLGKVPGGRKGYSSHETTQVENKTVAAAMRTNNLLNHLCNNFKK